MTPAITWDSVVILQCLLSSTCFTQFSSKPETIYTCWFCWSFTIPRWFSTCALIILYLFYFISYFHLWCILNIHADLSIYSFVLLLICRSKLIFWYVQTWYLSNSMQLRTWNHPSDPTQEVLRIWLFSWPLVFMI